MLIKNDIVSIATAVLIGFVAESIVCSASLPLRLTADAAIPDVGVPCMSVDVNESIKQYVKQCIDAAQAVEVVAEFTEYWELYYPLCSEQINFAIDIVRSARVALLECFPQDSRAHAHASDIFEDFFSWILYIPETDQEILKDLLACLGNTRISESLHAAAEVLYGINDLPLSLMGRTSA